MSGGFKADEFKGICGNILSVNRIPGIQFVSLDRDLTEVVRDALRQAAATEEERISLAQQLDNVQNELNQTKGRLIAVIKECDRHITDYQPKNDLVRCLQKLDNEAFEKIKAIAKGEIK